MLPRLLLERLRLLLSCRAPLVSFPLPGHRRLCLRCRGCRLQRVHLCRGRARRVLGRLELCAGSAGVGLSSVALLLGLVSCRLQLHKPVFKRLPPRQLVRVRVCSGRQLRAQPSSLLLRCLAGGADRRQLRTGLVRLGGQLGLQAGAALLCSGLATLQVLHIAAHSLQLLRHACQPHSRRGLLSVALLRHL
jgi:hypothetical protein